METIKTFIFVFVFIFIVGTITALTTDFISLDSFDSKLTKIYTSSFCLISTKCDLNTPIEIEVDFEMNSKTGVMKVNFESIERSKELEIIENIK